MTRHFLELNDLSVDELDRLLTLAESTTLGRPLEGKGVAMVFEKPSNRTRNSTEMAAFELGGHAIYIQGHEVGIDTRESAEDVARTLAGYHAIVCGRVFDHGLLTRMAEALDRGSFAVPVVNLLSGQSHPCQALADLLTLRQLFATDNAPQHEHGSLADRTLAYIGDANNMAWSVAQAGVMTGMQIRIASPHGYSFSESSVAALNQLASSSGRGGSVVVTDDPMKAATGVDVLYTDVWTSMGQEVESVQRVADFSGFTINTAMVDVAADNVAVMHCLPAHRGEEITDEVIEGPRSVVWIQAAHRKTAMRGLFAWLMEQQGQEVSV
jgi:ornithine carbamoyltransferase